MKKQITEKTNNFLQVGKMIDLNHHLSKRTPLSLIRLFKLAVKYMFESDLPNKEAGELSKKIAEYLKYVSEHKNDDL